MQHYTAHIARVHEGTEYKCEQCDKSYKDKQYLRKHVKRVHEEGIKIKVKNEIKVEIINCEFCEKAFNTKVKLRRHIKKVHEIKNHDGHKQKCDYCDLKFIEESDLVRHIQTGTYLFPDFIFHYIN